MAHKIRSLALGVVWRGDDLLFGEGMNSHKKEIFYRPLGGRIEFGEKAENTFVREFREELGVQIRAVSRLGVLENIFTYQNEPEHEIIFLFEGEFVDSSLYQKKSFWRVDQKQKRAVWVSYRLLEELNVYPPGIVPLLLSHKRSSP